MSTLLKNAAIFTREGFIRQDIILSDARVLFDFPKNEKVNKMFTLFRNIVYKNFPLIHPSTIRPKSGILRSGFWENSNILIKKLKNVFRKLTLTLYAQKWVFCGVVLQKFTYIFYSG